MTFKEEQIIKEWQYRKDHTFLLPHDDRTLKNYFTYKVGNIKILVFTLLMLVGLSFVFGVVFSLIGGNFKDSFIPMSKAWLLFFACGMILNYIYDYFLFINYVECDNMLYMPYVILGITAYFYFKVNEWSGVIIGIVLLVLSIRLFKYTYYEKQNDLQEMLDKQNKE